MLVQHTGYNNRVPYDEQTHDHISSNSLLYAQPSSVVLHGIDGEIQKLRADMSKLQITTSHPLPNKVSKQCVIIHYHYLCDVSGQ